MFLRPRLREPPAVIESVARFGYASKTQAARRARAETLARGVGAMLPHNFLKLQASRGPLHPGAVRPRGELGRGLWQGVIGFGAIRVVERRLDQLTK